MKINHLIPLFGFFIGFLLVFTKNERSNKSFILSLCHKKTPTFKKWELI
ncbi:MAG: hypothetical protein ACI9KR_000899 [Arcticibacterium sp.]|jgi:hypothetical protein